MSDPISWVCSSHRPCKHWLPAPFRTTHLGAVESQDTLCGTDVNPHIQRGQGPPRSRNTGFPVQPSPPNPMPWSPHSHPRGLSKGEAVAMSSGTSPTSDFPRGTHPESQSKQAQGQLAFTDTPAPRPTLLFPSVISGSRKEQAASLFSWLP